MKKTRKLIPAIAMLATSATMLATSSFAWFSMNNSVTATGMSVTATAPSSLLISTTSATAGFGSTVTLENFNRSAPSAGFSPAAYAIADDATSGAKPSAWYELTSAGAALVNETGAFNNSINKIDDGSESSAFSQAETSATGGTAMYQPSNSYYTDTVWLKMEGDEDKDIKATVTVDSSVASEGIVDAMHVLFVVSDEVVADLDLGSATNGSLETTEKIVSLAKNATGGGTQVDIYYYLSGNDTDCKNSVLPADKTLSVTITFSVTDTYTGNNS